MTRPKISKKLSVKGRKLHGPTNELEVIDAPADRFGVIEFKVPEFAHLCPITGQPDPGTIWIRYIPALYYVETRSLMRYLWTFRNKEIFHEEIPQAVLSVLTEALEPKWAEVMGDFLVRGVSWEKVVATHEPSETSDRLRRAVDRHSFRF